jgi:hypothetical protein
MPAPHPIEAAESILRELGGFPADSRRIPPAAEVLSAIERFAPVEFAVADLPEQDGFLFQYTTVTAGAAAFVLSFVRQFEVVDPEDQEHEYFVHLRCEYRYPVEDDLVALGHTAQWWFKSGPEPFDVWLERVRTDPVWSAAAGHTPTAFVIRQETV